MAPPLPELPAPGRAPACLPARPHNPNPAAAPRPQLALGSDPEAAEYAARISEAVLSDLAAVDTPAALKLLLDGAAELLAPGGSRASDDHPAADHNSLVGLFLRRCFAAYAAMPFEVRGRGWRGGGCLLGRERLSMLQMEGVGC